MSESARPRSLRRAIRGGIFLVAVVASFPCVRAAVAPTRITVTDEIVQPAERLRPFGAGGFGDLGGVSYAANNFVLNPGNEPLMVRRAWRVIAVGDGWFEVDRGGASCGDTFRTGFFSGADVRVYRLVDAQGASLPINPAWRGGYLDLSRADHVVLVRRDRVIPRGTPGFPMGGHIADRYAMPAGTGLVRHNTSCVDPSRMENGRTYHYAVVALDAAGNVSAPSSEISVTPRAGVHGGLGIFLPQLTNSDGLFRSVAGQAFGEFAPWAIGAQGAVRWELTDWNDQPAVLPEGMVFNAGTGAITGTPVRTPGPTKIRLRARDASGATATRDFVLAAQAPAAAPADHDAPLPPGEVRATPGDSYVALEWTPSASADVVAYRILRSETPRDQQRERFHLAGPGPAIEKYDYIYLDQPMLAIDPGTLSPRLAPTDGQGNALVALDAANPDSRLAPSDRQPIAWPWIADHPGGVTFALAPHPAPLPEEFTDGGRSCLKIVARDGEQSIRQDVFTGTRGLGKKWYARHWLGQLEPGRAYRVEVWMRQEGLGDGGRVRFGYSSGEKAYPTIGHTFAVDGTWRKHTWDFTAPERPTEAGEFGHQFTFTGPGTLWLDNCRIFRCDRPEDLARPYVPNPETLRELLAYQPARGRKGTLRFYGPVFNYARMDSLVGFHADSHLDLGIDDTVAVAGNPPMTLASALEFAFRTGDSPADRMRPFITIQQFFAEDEWLGFIEYLAAPYDPARDTPQTKPYAWQRFRQRGTGVPWTDEFEDLTIELGNETWHNGLYPDWHGYGPYGYIGRDDPRYGIEYGLFAEHVFRQMAASPYWASQGLARKIKFNLGGFYDGRALADGSVVGYAEVAKQHCPSAASIGHAVYIGAAQWETGIKNQKNLYDPEGVMAAYIAFQANDDGLRLRRRQAEARDALAARGVPYDIVAYEGGPSGSGLLPDRELPEHRYAYQQYRHSKALGVAVLDGFLACTKLGWRDMNFYYYGQGAYTASHLPAAAGLRPKPSWLSLTMRNRHAPGDLIGTRDEDAPVLPLPGRAVPLVVSYAFRDGDRYAVFVLSMKVPGMHAGVDFADGFTPVTLSLPFGAARRIILHRLGGDVMATNLDAMDVRIETQDVPAAALDSATRALTIDAATGGGPGGLPPGSAFLYVFEGATQRP